MCKSQLLSVANGEENHRIQKGQKLGQKRRRPYTSFPAELSPFYVNDQEKPFKKENLRQSLARAVQTLKLTTENQCVYKRGLVHPMQVDERLKEEIREIIESDKAKIESFIYPKTCLRRETRKPAKYRSKDRSWNSKKWEEFCSITGIKSLLRVVLQLVFQSKDLNTLCNVWERDCCKGKNHCEETCMEKWRNFMEFCKKDCGIEGEETEASTGMDEVDEDILTGLMEDIDFFLNPSYCL